MLLNPYRFGAAPPPSTLKLDCPFSASFVDLTGNRTLSGNGGAAINAGPPAGLLLDGNGDYLSASAFADMAIPGDFSIKFKATKSGNGINGFDAVLTTYTVSSTNDGYWVELSSSRGFLFAGPTTSGGGGSALIYAQYNFNPNDGIEKEYEVVRVGSGAGNFLLKIDGSTVATATRTQALPANQLNIGQNISLYNEFFNGRIRDLTINIS